MPRRFALLEWRIRGEGIEEKEDVQKMSPSKLPTTAASSSQAVYGNWNTATERCVFHEFAHLQTGSATNS
jgi:hypothetical protein